MASGVIVCQAIKVIIAHLVGSAMALKYVSSHYFKNFFMKSFGCKYMCNFLVS
jgi:hypothetical protein